MSAYKIVDPIFVKEKINNSHTPRLAELNPYDYYLRRTLKDRVYVNNPHSLQEQKDNTWKEIASTSKEALLCE